MELIPNVVEETLGDKRATKLKELLVALEPVKHYTALHKTREAFASVRIHFSNNPGRFWFWMEHGTESIGGEERVRRHCCEYHYYPDKELGREWSDRKLRDVGELYLWVEREYGRETQPCDVIVYETELRTFVRSHLCLREMHQKRWLATKDLVLKKLEYAAEIVRQMEPGKTTQTSDT